MSWRPPPDEMVAYGLFEHPTSREDGEPEIVRLRCDNDYRAEYEAKGFRFRGLAKMETDRTVPVTTEPEPEAEHEMVQGTGYDPIDEAAKKKASDRAAVVG